MEKEIRDKEKVERVLGIYTKLLDGITVNKQKEAEKVRANSRFSSALAFLSSIMLHCSVVAALLP